MNKNGYYANMPSLSARVARAHCRRERAPLCAMSRYALLTTCAVCAGAPVAIAARHAASFVYACLLHYADAAALAAADICLRHLLLLFISGIMRGTAADAAGYVYTLTPFTLIVVAIVDIFTLLLAGAAYAMFTPCCR